MAFSSHRKFFKGVLAGVPVSRIFELDYSKNTLAQRKKFIENKYKETKKFYDAFIFTKEEKIDNGSICEKYTEEELTQYYKYNLTNDDELSSEINVFRSIERDASYILNSLDLEKRKNMKYNFLTEEEFKAILKKEKSLSVYNNENEEYVMDILKPDFKNEYTNFDHKITKKDLEDPLTKEILGAYNKFKIFLKCEMEKIKNREGSKLSLYQIRNNLKEVNDDMIRSKIALRGTRCPAKRLGDESGKFYYDLIDYKNPNHILQIIKNIRFGDLRPDSDLSHLAYDVKNAITILHNNKKIDDIDLEIIECVNYGYTNVAIAAEINRDEKVVRRRTKKICDKLSEYFKNCEK